VKKSETIRYKSCWRGVRAKKRQGNESFAIGTKLYIPSTVNTSKKMLIAVIWADKMGWFLAN
jgi:hypothetical protein